MEQILHLELDEVCFPFAKQDIGILKMIERIPGGFDFFGPVKKINSFFQTAYGVVPVC